ncbi:MAG: hypothetical protein ACLP3C_02710 [Mycobacterium sp.]|uniref:hypothetical protein n=1 Tax=Mycobacterium sp. TaxID=1785 RepID=UPI003F95CBAC
MNRALLTAAASMIGLGMFAAPAHADTECGGVGPNHAVRVVAVGPTSCPFALSVAQQMMGGAGTYFNATSSVTGETYRMHCWIKYHGSTTCEDVNGGGAEVQIF